MDKECADENEQPGNYSIAKVKEIEVIEDE